MDGMTQKIYEKYRVGGDLLLLKNNLEKMTKVKEQFRFKTPIIELQLILIDLALQNMV